MAVLTPALLQVRSLQSELETLREREDSMSHSQGRVRAADSTPVDLGLQRKVGALPPEAPALLAENEALRRELQRSQCRAEDYETVMAGLVCSLASLHAVASAPRAWSCPQRHFPARGAAGGRQGLTQ